jgi:hypothetical protein
MPWNYTNTEFTNAIKDLKRDFLTRAGLGGGGNEIRHEVFKDEDISVRIKCLNFMSLFQDCIEQTNNDTSFCLPYYKLFLDCKGKVE